MRNDTQIRFPFQELDVYRAARELAALVHTADIRDAGAQGSGDSRCKERVPEPV